MPFFQSLVSTAGMVVAITAYISVAVGAAGGIWALYDRWKSWKESKFRHGERGMSMLLVQRDQGPDGFTWDMLVVGDLIHMLRGVLEAQFRGRLCSLEKVGDYYRCTVRFPPGIEPVIKESWMRRL
jgi:hypothetical protein